MRRTGRLAVLFAALTLGLHPAGDAAADAFWRTSDGAALSDTGSDLEAAIGRLPDLGANRDVYRLPARGDAAARERAMDALFMRLVRDLAVGRDSMRRAQPDLFLQPRPVDTEQALARVRAGERPSDVLASLGDHGAGYWRLVDEHRRVRALTAGGPWPHIGATSPTDPAAAAHRAALAADALQRLGYPAQDMDGDRQFAAAIADFQRDHGLEPDGVIGRETANWLSMTPDDRAALIAINIERLRWLGAPAPGPRVDVNIAAFVLTVFERNETVRHMPVIVGKAYRRTPQFESRFSQIVFNPSWTPTPKIIRQSLAPKFRADGGQLQALGFDVLDRASGARLNGRVALDWAKYETAAFPYVLRQRPGPQNALGRIKFDLPNDFAIYLHDTPDRDLFQKRVRSFSSGCVRVSDPVWLASWMLETPEAEIERILAAPETRRTPVARPIQLRLFYLTAWKPADGRLQVRADLYARDRALLAALGRPTGAEH